MPRTAQGNFGQQEIFRIKINNIEYDYSVNTISPVDRQLLQFLQDAPVNLQLIRVGTGKTTRITIKKA